LSRNNFFRTGIVCLVCGATLLHHFSAAHHRYSNHALPLHIKQMAPEYRVNTQQIIIPSSGGWQVGSHYLS